MRPTSVVMRVMSVVIGCVVLLGMLIGCAGRRVGASVQDQTFVPGPSSRAEAPAINEAEDTRGQKEPLSLADIYFDFDQFAIRRDAQATLESNARVLKQDHGGKIVIEGHCDERGTMAYNMVLGERRANAARRYLQELGVPASRIETVSYGKERPFCTDHSEVCWQSNRRAHFRRP